MILLLACVLSCQNEKSADQQNNALSTPIVAPPVNGVNVPYREYIVDAEKGDTLYDKSGGIILIPPHAFVDQNGKEIKGGVQIKYRSFSKPIDFFLAGIPMSLDSLGVGYSLISDGMLEILAFQNDKPVFVNPRQMPEIFMPVRDSISNYNAYFLDTIKGGWVSKGPSTLISDKPSEVPAKPASVEAIETPEPVKPAKADNNRPVIQILIDSSSFPELLAYNNLLFQVDPSEKYFNPGDSVEEWNHVELVKTNQKGKYIARFSNANKAVSYLVIPVLEGGDYTMALATFKNKKKEYERNKKARIRTEQKLNRSIVIDSIPEITSRSRNKDAIKLRKLIEARNKKIESLNNDIDAINESFNDFRMITISQFGYYNIDIPVRDDLLWLDAKFQTDSGPASPSNIAVICKGLNTIYRPVGNKIGVVFKRDNMIVAVVNGEFGYVSYDEYRKLDITRKTTLQVFHLTMLSGNDNTYEKITSIANE